MPSWSQVLGVSGVVPSYILHGLRLHSEFPIGGLPQAPLDSCPPDVEVHFGFLPEPLDEVTATADWYQSSESDPAGEPLLTIRRIVASGDLWLRYADGTQFLISASADSVFAVWAQELTVDDAIIYLLGPVLGILLRARGRICLHASVVATGDQAVGFVGPAGAGKSTIAAAFARAGHAVLSDDLLVLSRSSERLCVEPGYSWLRLWPASVEGLFGSPDALPLLVRGWDKRYLDLAAQDAFCAEPLPLGAIYVIGDRRSDLALPTFERLSPRAALMQLIANSYAGRLPLPSARRREFEAFGRLVSDVPLRQVTLGSEWHSIARLPAAVMNDFNEACPLPTAYE